MENWRLMYEAQVEHGVRQENESSRLREELTQVKQQLAEARALLRRAAPWTERSSVAGGTLGDEYANLQHDLRTALGEPNG